MLHYTVSGCWCWVHFFSGKKKYAQYTVHRVISALLVSSCGIRKAAQGPEQQAACLGLSRPLLSSELVETLRDSANMAVGFIEMGSQLYEVAQAI